MTGALIGGGDDGQVRPCAANESGHHGQQAWCVCFVVWQPVCASFRAVNTMPSDQCTPSYWSWRHACIDGMVLPRC
jgi:hypothetical protein